MADRKLVELTEETAPEADDILYLVTDTDHTPADRKVSVSTLLAQSYVVRVPSSLTLVAGTPTGTVAGVQDIFDGVTYNIVEVAATPGFNVEFNFTSIVRQPLFAVVRAYYAGSATHGVGIDLYNYNATTYNRLTHFAGGLDYGHFLVYIPNPEDYVDGSGNAKLRIYHFTGGNPAHNIAIDFVALACRP